MREALGARWLVRRRSGLLVPGFRKRFSADGRCGVTYLLGLRIGRFDVLERDGGIVELHYRRWPVVDVLARPPRDAQDGAIRAAGYVRLPHGRRARFCRFDLHPPAPR